VARCATSAGFPRRPRREALRQTAPVRAGAFLEIFQGARNHPEQGDLARASRAAFLRPPFRFHCSVARRVLLHNASRCPFRCNKIACRRDADGAQVERIGDKIAARAFRSFSGSAPGRSTTPRRVLASSARAAMGRPQHPANSNASPMRIDCAVHSLGSMATTTK
jgi:hypothetical protein